MHHSNFSSDVVVGQILTDGYSLSFSTEGNQFTDLEFCVPLSIDWNWELEEGTFFSTFTIQKLKLNFPILDMEYFDLAYTTDTGNFIPMGLQLPLNSQMYSFFFEFFSVSTKTNFLF